MPLVDASCSFCAFCCTLAYWHIGIPKPHPGHTKNAQKEQMTQQQNDAHNGQEIQ